MILIFHILADIFFISGTILQEIKVDCDIDDRASIVITKKGKAWEVNKIKETSKKFRRNLLRFGNSSNNFKVFKL